MLLKGSLTENLLLKNYTTFNIGGQAKYFIIPQNIKELLSILQLYNKYDLYYFILGAKY